MAETAPIRVGISSCLLGERVRFDGGHKRDSFVADVLARYVELVPVCPEVELGLGVPRETLRLEREDDGLVHLRSKSGRDLTAAMRRFSSRRVASLEALELCGYILKRASPSCGMERVKVYAGSGPPARDGRGLFAESLCARYPLLPVEEEGRLCDDRLRDNFVERVFAYARLKAFFRGRWTLAGLCAFHTAHKLELLAHAPRAYEALGRLVARAKELSGHELRQRYEAAFMGGLSVLATRGRHANVLSHMAGHLRHKLDAGDRAELRALVEDYRRGLVPLVVPVTLVRHHARRLADAYLLGQTGYLDPHPRELMLRNRV
jgi:uncharacterized protein YbgA (DUF1722 family)/uncharacterized protein YbbK (DUF523 family)